MPSSQASRINRRRMIRIDIARDSPPRGRGGYPRRWLPGIIAIRQSYLVDGVEIQSLAILHRVAAVATRGGGYQASSPYGRAISSMA
jgi:hypothetical protein